MAARSNQDLSRCIVKGYVVEAGQTTTAGKAVKFGTADNAVQDSGAASDLMIGVALESKAAGERVQVALPFVAIVEMVVGTGGATRGKKQKVVADGVTDAPTAAFTNEVEIIGIAMQSGVATDKIGVGLFPMSRGSA